MKTQTTPDLSQTNAVSSDYGVRLFRHALVLYGMTYVPRRTAQWIDIQDCVQAIPATR